MGTYSKIKVKFLDKSTTMYEIKADPTWIAEEILEADFWKAPDDDTVREFLEDDLYAWESEPTSCISYYFYIDVANKDKCFYQETDFHTTEPIGDKFPLIALCIDGCSKLVRQYIRGLTCNTDKTSLPEQLTLRNWLDLHKDFDIVQANKSYYEETPEGHKKIRFSKKLYDRYIENIILKTVGDDIVIEFYLQSEES